MQKYKQLDLQDRHKIHALLEAGQSKTKIAEIIGVQKSTISRELIPMFLPGVFMPTSIALNRLSVKPTSATAINANIVGLPKT